MGQRPPRAPSSLPYCPPHFPLPKSGETYPPPPRQHQESPHQSLRAPRLPDPPTKHTHRESEREREGGKGRERASSRGLYVHLSPASPASSPGRTWKMCWPEWIYLISHTIGIPHSSFHSSHGKPHQPDSALPPALANHTNFTNNVRKNHQGFEVDRWLVSINEWVLRGAAASAARRTQNCVP